MRKKEEVFDKTRNNNFAAAFDYLKQRGEVGSQLELARKMGVNKDTITNILNAYTPVTEDKITRLQAATGNIFNLQWLRGESDVMLAADVKNVEMGREPVTDDSHYQAMIDAKQDIIMLLNRQAAMVEESAKHEIEAYRREAEASKREAEACKREAESMQREAEASRREAEASRREVEARQSEVKAKQREIDLLKSQLADRQTTIDRLQQSLDDLRMAMAVMQSADKYPFVKSGVADDGSRQQPHANP